MPMRSMISPRRCLSRAGRAKSLGNVPLRVGLSRSISTERLKLKPRFVQLQGITRAILMDVLLAPAAG